MLQFEQLSDGDAERAFSRFNTGRWWEETEVRGRPGPLSVGAEGVTLVC